MGGGLSIAKGDGLVMGVDGGASKAEGVGLVTDVDGGISKTKREGFVTDVDGGASMGKGEGLVMAGCGRRCIYDFAHLFFSSASATSLEDFLTFLTSLFSTLT